MTTTTMRTITIATLSRIIRQFALPRKGPGRPWKTVVTGFLIIDDSTHAKRKGKKMEGLGQHYSTTESKTIKGHSMLASLYVLLGRRCPLTPRLYRQERVCQEEKVPFQSKVEMAEEMIRTFQPVPGTKTHVLVDAWYTCRQLWRTVREMGWAMTGGLKANRKMRVEDPVLGRRYVPVSQYTGNLAAEEYQEVAWPHEDGSSRLIYVHLVRTLVKHLGACQVLIVRERLNQPLKEARYWATSELEADTATVVSWAAQRWAIETFFADVKEVLGTDQYQLRSAQGLIRFWHLAFLAYCYLEGQRAALVAEGANPQLTIGQTRWHQQKRHRRLLLEWIHERFKDGQTPEQVDQLLAA